MYSPRSRCFLSARAAALLRWTSRSLRQATYSGEPATTLLARQKVSSSSLSVDVIGDSPRRAQADSARARTISAVQVLAGLSCIQYPVGRASKVIAGINQKQGRFLKYDGGTGQARASLK